MLTIEIIRLALEAEFWPLRRPFGSLPENGSSGHERGDVKPENLKDDDNDVQQVGLLLEVVEIDPAVLLIILGKTRREALVAAISKKLQYFNLSFHVHSLSHTNLSA